VLDHVGGDKMTARRIEQPGGMDEGEVLGIGQFRKRPRGGVEAKLERGVLHVHDEMSGVVAVGEDPQIGIARRDEIRVARRRQ
jgi:hypothetical protein